MISSKTMKAVVLTSPTAADEIILTDIPVPKVRPGWVLVKVRAFGLNHSEQILRLKEISAKYIQKPIIPGIECVGEIADSSDSQFRCGQEVVALMGGMGRSFNGSYAQYALLLLPRGLQPALRDVEEAQYLAGVLRVEIAGLGEAHALARAVEELDAQLVLQRINLVADGGLREAQLLRRARKVQVAGHGQEAFQLCRIQTKSRPCGQAACVR